MATMNLIAKRNSRKRPSGNRGAQLKHKRRESMKRWLEKKARLAFEEEEAKIRFGTDRVVHLDGEWFPKDTFKNEEDERVFALARLYARGLKFSPSIMYEDEKKAHTFQATATTSSNVPQQHKESGSA